MNYLEFESIVSEERLNRYLLACNGNKLKALLLYRRNVRASMEMFSVVGAFEIALRNSIDKVMIKHFGADWLRNSILPGGIFDTPKCRDHARIIRGAYEKLVKHNQYTHSHLLSKMEFGIWKYMFSSPQFKASHRVLLQVFPNKPTSTREIQYNNTFIFNELDHVNSLRNRIAHHEPICFYTGFSLITTTYIEFIYHKIIVLFDWLGVSAQEYLFGLDHVKKICSGLKMLE